MAWLATVNTIKPQYNKPHRPDNQQQRTHNNTQQRTHNKEHTTKNTPQQHNTQHNTQHATKNNKNTKNRQQTTDNKTQFDPLRSWETRHPFSKALLPWPMANVVIRWDNAWFSGTRDSCPAMNNQSPDQTGQEDHSTSGYKLPAPP